MNPQIYELLFALSDALKEEGVYQDYLRANEALKEDRELLERYKKCKEDYLRAKPLMVYQDFSDLKQEVLALGKQVTELDHYQDYFKTRQRLEARLDQLTTLIFGEDKR